MMQPLSLQVGFLGFLGFLGLLVLASCRPVRSASAPVDAIAIIEREFGVAVVSSDVATLLEQPGRGVSGVDPDSSALLEYSRFLVKELREYPRDAFACAGIRKIILATPLLVRMEPRAAVPLPDIDALVLNPSPVFAREDYLARVFHHEFYHMLDGPRSARVLNEAAWREVNPAEFSYGRGGGTAYTSLGDFFSIRSPTDGFITAYAMTAIEEDRAEVFSTLILMPKEVQALASQDRRLQLKIDLLKQHLRAMCPSFLGIV